MKVGEVFVRMAMDYSQYDKDERAAKGRVTTLGSSLSGILKNAFSFGLGMGFFQAVQRGFQATVGSALNYNVVMQQAAIGFETMLGSAQRAQAFVNEMADFAARTPFEFQDLLTASKRMMALGFASSDVLPTLGAIGDAAAALGTGQEGINTMITALGQMRTAGKVNSRQMMQLSQAGVPAWDMLAKAIGRSTSETRELVEKGLVSADQGIAAFVTGVNQRFPGMMQKMEDSWAGVTSTIKDVWRMTLGDMTSGLFRRANEWLKRVRDTASGFYDAYKRGGLKYAIEQTFGPEAAAAIGTISTALSALWSVAVWVGQGITSAGRWIIAHWSAIGPVVRWALAGFLAFRIVTGVFAGVKAVTNGLTLAITVLKGQFNATKLSAGFLQRAILAYNAQVAAGAVTSVGFAGALQVVKAAIHSVTAALGPLLWPLIIVGVLLGAGMSLWSKYSASVQQAAQKAQMEKMAAQQKAYLESVNAATKGTNDQADAFKELGEESGKNLQSFDEVHSLMDEMAGATAQPSLDTSVPGMPELPDYETAKATGMFDAIWSETEGAKATLGGFWDWIKDEAGNAWANLASTIGGKWAEIKTNAATWWDGIKASLAERWAGIKASASERFEAIKTTVAEKWDAAKAKAAEIWDAVRSALAEKWEATRTKAGEIWESVRGTLAEKWDAAKAKAAEVWENVRGTISEKWQALRTSAPVVWEDIKTSISTRWNDLKTAASTTWELVRGTVAENWDALKTNAPRVWEDIKRSITERFTDAKEKVVTAAGYMRDEAPKAWRSLVDQLEERRGALVAALTSPWETAKATVLGWIESARSWGKQLVANITAGINGGGGAIQAAVNNVATTVEGYLAYESPAKEGPGRYADRWAPNLMRMYTEGILANVGRVQAAVRDVAQSLAPMTAAPDLALAGVSGGGNRGSMPVVSAPSWPGGGPAPEIHLHIGTLVADSQGLRQLERKLREIRYAEDQRTGVSGS